MLRSLDRICSLTNEDLWNTSIEQGAEEFGLLVRDQHMRMEGCIKKVLHCLIRHA